jgi:hypothetical protein
MGRIRTNNKKDNYCSESKGDVLQYVKRIYELVKIYMRIGKNICEIRTIYCKLTFSQV